MNTDNPSIENPLEDKIKAVNPSLDNSLEDKLQTLKDVIKKKEKKTFEEHGERLIPVRVSPVEIRYLNMLQGEQTVDPKTGLRSYAKLGEILKIPVIKNLFVVAMKMANEQKVPDHLETLVNKLDSEAGETVEPIPSDAKPEVKSIEAEGDAPDTRIVMLPESVAAFFEALQGGPQRDPTRGWDEFFKKKSNAEPIPLKGGGIPIISDVVNTVTKPLEWVGVKRNHINEGLRIAGTIGGAMMGGPMGAGFGNAAASMATGKGPMDFILSGAKNAALVYGTNAIAPSLGLPAFGARAGAAAPITQAGGALKATGATTAASKLASHSAAASSGAGGMMGGLGKFGVPLVGAGLLMSMHGKKKEQQQEEQKARESKEDYERELTRSGFHTPLQTKLAIPTAAEHQRINPLPPPRLSSYRDGGATSSYGSDKPYWASHGYKTGGSVAIEGKPIIGPGTGQSDSINVDSTKEGEWIWDASTTSDLGDGTTDAGWKQIRRLEKFVRRQPGFKEMYEYMPNQKPQKIKTALSNGEYRTPTKIVTMIGRGHNERGANILRRMTQDIRLYKISRKDQLPPPIGDPLHFFHQATEKEFGHA